MFQKIPKINLKVKDVKKLITVDNVQKTTKKLLNKINKHKIEGRIKNISSKKIYKHKVFKPALVISCMVLVIMSVTLVVLISNHNSFIKLNAAMEEVYVSPYDSNNLLVKDETLEDMKIKIEEHIILFNLWYEQNIGLSEENSKELIKSLTSEKEAEVKLKESKQIFLQDISEKNKGIKQTIEELANKDITYNSSEQKVADDIEEEYTKITDDTNLKVALDNYEKLSQYKELLNDNMNKAQDRITQEKAEAEQKAKEEAEKKAKEEAEKKAKEEAEKKAKEEASVSNSNTTSASGNFDRTFASGIYNAINAYRSSLGLPVYSYNSTRQSCVDTEAKAYASNGNPHNYLCQPISAENAAYAYNGYYSSTDIVNAWKQDEPHHRPLKSSTYTSVAVSAYRSGNYIYIEACFW